MYIGFIYPLNTLRKNRIEFFNEMCILSCSVIMMLFTDFVPEIETQVSIGWQMIAIIVLGGIVNIVGILLFGGKKVYLIYQKYYKLLKHKFYPEKKD